MDSGVDTIVYTIGESTIDVEKRFLYEESEWPVRGEIFGNLRDLNHASWAVREASRECDVIHLNTAAGMANSRFVKQPAVYTVHHANEPSLSDFYGFYPDVHFVCISDFQGRQQKLPNWRTIHHGVDLNRYRLIETKQDYLCFLGRIAPVKGVHLAIEVAKKAGLPLKIGGQVQPIYGDYYDQQVKPHVDGKFIEYVGEVDLAAKNELLGHARAMLFPIQWHEPFGLVMIEAMACGTPVLALPGGSVPEVVAEGLSGHICRSVEEMAERARTLTLNAAKIRGYVAERFTVERMTADYVALYRELVHDQVRAEQSVA
jgi:glycosyltransferase involved in cell wall biosynthesis